MGSDSAKDFYGQHPPPPMDALVGCTAFLSHRGVKQRVSQETTVGSDFIK